MKRQAQGFTLAELLIALGLLGLIAAFTIPKLLVSNRIAVIRANAKEVAAMISEAYDKYSQATTPTASTKPSDLLPYMNYVQLDTSGTLIDAHPLATSRTCNATTPCVKLHNGGVLWFQDNMTFGGTGAVNVIEFDFDPDGTYSGSAADSTGKSIQFSLYYNGQLATRGQLKTGTCDSGGCNPPLNSAFDPSWFTW